MVVKVLIVCTITKTLVDRRPLMKQKGSYIGIYARFVGQKMENSLHTHSLNVGSLKIRQKRVKMGMPRSRHAHPSRTLVNSNWGKHPDPSPFSSPGSLNLAFRRAIAFCNRQDQRLYAQVLSSHCDSPFHKSGKWSGSTENSYLVNSSSSVCGQYSKKTQHFGGSKAAVLYKNCKQVCLSDVKPDPACSADRILSQDYGCNQDNGKVKTLSRVGDIIIIIIM